MRHMTVDQDINFIKSWFGNASESPLPIINSPVRDPWYKVYQRIITRVPEILESKWTSSDDAMKRKALGSDSVSFRWRSRALHQ